MIVNVNPYDTGFDENSHVMKFAALAREVYTTPTQAPIQRVPPSPTKIAQGNKGGYPGLRKPGEFAPVRRQVTISTSGPGRKFSQAHLEVLEGMLALLPSPTLNNVFAFFLKRMKRWERQTTTTATTNPLIRWWMHCSMKLRNFVCRCVNLTVELDPA